MAHELRTEIQIDAPPSTVWAVLTDLPAYPDWNPFITSSEGTVAVGERLKNRLEPPGAKAVTFKPTITAIDEGRTLEWLGRLVLPGLFDGRHRFELVPEASSTRLIQQERFTGLLVPLLRRQLDGPTRAGFETMNAALKSQAEAGTVPRPGA